MDDEEEYNNYNHEFESSSKLPETNNVAHQNENKMAVKCI